MSGGTLNRRLLRLERGRAVVLPLHLPLDKWTDEHLIALIAQDYPDVDVNVSAERLAEICEGAMQ